MKLRLHMLLFFLMLFAGKSIGQTHMVDSLKRIIHSGAGFEQKLAAVFELNEQAVNADSLLPYVRLAQEMARTSSDRNAEAKALLCLAGYYGRKNEIDSGMAILNQLISSYRNKPADQKLYLKFLFFRAKLSDRANQYSKALTELYGVVETAANQKDTLILIQAKTGIGWVLIEMEQYNDALKWLFDARRTSGNREYYKNYGALFSNLAVAFNGTGNKDSALFYINRAIADARQNENLVFLATALSMQAKIFVDNGLSSLAEAPLHEVLNIRKQLNDPFYVVFDMSNLASYYAGNGQPQKGIRVCMEGIVLAKQLGLPSQLLMIYRALAENYKAAGDQEQYGRTLEEIIGLKDSFNTINSTKMLAEMQAANEARKQEKTINEQNLNLTIKNYILYGSALFALMAAAIGWLAFKNYKRKQRLKMELAVEKEKILGAQAAKDAGEQERKRIAADLHDNLGAQANAILYSTELLQQEKEGTEVLVTDLHHTAKDMLTSLRETLWVMKAAGITTADVWLRIVNFARQINRHYPQLKIVTEGLAPQQVPVPSAKALNIVFIVQEAVNNAIRHASAETILISSSFANANWSIEIIDNGKGFDLEAASKKQESYGLSNMKQRATAEDFNLEITSADKGTRLTLTVPVAQGNPNGVLQEG